jgi:hypothetical protein
MDLRSKLTGEDGGAGGGADGGVTLRTIVDKWLAAGGAGVGDGAGGAGGAGGGAGGAGGGAGGDSLLVLERDGVGLWPAGRFGIHNAFIITKPKNPLFLECIFSIVSSSKSGLHGNNVGLSFGTDLSVGWMTRPLFVTGPGLLGDVWRRRFKQSASADESLSRSSSSSSSSSSNLENEVVPDSYATMAPYFRFFFEGNGSIGYFIDEYKGEYITSLLKVYDGYQEEYHHMMHHSNCMPHYTVLWSQGIVWRGVPPPNDGNCV